MSSANRMMVVQPGRNGCWKKSSVSGSEPRTIHSTENTRTAETRSVNAAEPAMRNRRTRRRVSAKFPFPEASRVAETRSATIFANLMSSMRNKKRHATVIVPSQKLARVAEIRSSAALCSKAGGTGLTRRPASRHTAAEKKSRSEIMAVAFTFPGQGSQAVGMGKDLADTFPEARRVFDEVDDALGQKLSKIMWEGPEETLTLTANAQPALMAVSLA